MAATSSGSNARRIPPQRAKTYTGDYITALTGWAATMMALWEVKRAGRGQVIDLAQYEAVAQTNGNTLPLFTGEGGVSDTAETAPRAFSVYDTFKCSDGWVYIGALGGAIYDRRPQVSWARPGRIQLRGLFEGCRRGRFQRAGNSTGDCAFTARRAPALEVETALNEAKIGCARVFNTRDQYNDPHYAARADDGAGA